ncbi:MAG TPA: hypothetical protein VGP68_22390 [Gemmataceae bacterium]|jgi:predicted negative regulator of RcsB-dependent stress response|nr:hypothetical protein [Gemmataceae bacterium]
MKAEHRHRLEQNALADRVGRVVQSVKAAPATQSLALWLGVAAVVIVIIAWQLFRSASSMEASALWRNLDAATRGPDDYLRQLENLRDEHPGTMAGTSASFQLARIKFAEGQINLGNSLESDRKDAIKKLASARDMYAQLARDTSDVPLLMQESLMMQAKIDESLTGVADPDKPDETLGSLAMATKQYQELASKYPESAAGKAAKKRLEDLEKNKVQVEDFYAQFNQILTLPQMPINLDSGPIHPPLPGLPANLTNPESKPPIEIPPAAKSGEYKVPATTPAKPGDGKANPAGPPSTKPTIPIIPTTPPDSKPGTAAPPAAKAPVPAAPKAGDAKTPPPPAPDKKQ